MHHQLGGTILEDTKPPVDEGQRDSLPSFKHNAPPKGLPVGVQPLSLMDELVFASKTWMVHVMFSERSMSFSSQILELFPRIGFLLLWYFHLYVRFIFSASYMASSSQLTQMRSPISVQFN